MTPALLNVVLGGLDLLAVDGVRRGRVAGAASLWATGVAVAFVVFSGGDLFAATQGLAWILFVHFPLATLGAALWLPGRRRVAAVAAAFALAGAGAWSVFVEPHRLEVTTVELEVSGVDRELSIALVSDLQTDDPGVFERRALEAVAGLDADLVLFTGDFVQLPAARYPEAAATLAGMLRQAGLEPSLGAWAVRGNVDPPARWRQALDGTGIRPLDATTRLDLGPLVLTGLALDDSFDVDLRLAAEEKPHVVFGHAPDFALGEVPADLLLAGHTHGGQVRLPFIGPLITFSRVPRSWAAGVTSLDGGRTLVVSRGVGMERGRAGRLRFLCRPQIVEVRLLPGTGAPVPR